MPRRISLGAFLLCSLTLLTSPTWAATPKVVIATGLSAGGYFPVGGTICRLANREKRRDSECTIAQTGGSVANLEALKKGDVQFAFTQSDLQYSAYHGTLGSAPTDEFSAMRSVFSLYPDVWIAVTRADSGIADLSGLRGKRINIGDSGSGTRATMEELLHMKGWKASMFKMAANAQAKDAKRLLCGGESDAFIMATGQPSGLIQDIALGCPVRLISADQDTIRQLTAEYPYYLPATIPGGMYRNNPSDIQSFGVKATLVSTKDVPEDTVYELVKAVFEHFDDFRSTNPMLSTLDQRAMIKDGLTAPLHEGAKRYYREKGWIP